MNILALFILTFLSIVIGNFEIQNTRSNITGVYVYLLSFVLFITFRGLYFPDTLAYTEYFKNINTNLSYFISNDVYGSVDVGYAILNQAVKIVFGDNFRALFFIISFINLFILYKSFSILAVDIYRNMQNSILYVFFFSLYISYYGFLYNGAVLRAGIALSFLMYSYVMCFRRKWIWAFVFYILAIQFHSSAIVGIIIAFILIFVNKLSDRTYFLIWITIGILLFSNIRQISINFFPEIFNFLSNLESLKVFSKYENSQYIYSIGSGVSLKYIYFYLMGGLFLRGSQNLFFYKLLNVYYIGLIILAIFPVSYMSRIADFFMFFVFILQYLFILNFEGKQTKMIIYSAIVILNTIFVSRILYQGLLW